jgi:hypothetical protein
MSNVPCRRPASCCFGFAMEDSLPSMRRVDARPSLGQEEQLTEEQQRGSCELSSEVDLVIETGSGALIGIEVKASATANAGDFKGLRK